MEDPKQPSPPPNTPRANAKIAALLNFRSLILKCVMASVPDMFPQKDQIEQRIQELVPSCPTPRHPPYDWMIGDAITWLNGERGSSAESISKFILGKHKDLLPLAHATFLKHHLKKLCESGFLVVNDDGLYFLGKETNQHEPKPATDPDPSLDNGFESDSTSSSGESFSQIMEMEMIKRYKDKTGGKRENVHCRALGRNRDLSVGIELEQKNEVEEERIDEPQRVVWGQKRKRGRPQKIITTNSDQTVKPRKKLGRPRKTVNNAVAEEALVGQDKVVADYQNMQNGDQEFRPKNSDDTANITRGEQLPEPKPKPKPDPDPSSDYGYESCSTSSSGEIFSPIMEIEMSKRCKGKTGRRIQGRGKNVRCRTRSREMDLLVGNELEQENEVDGERIDEPQRVVCENSISRLRTGKQGPKWKRGRPRKYITLTTSSNKQSNPQKKLGRPRKNAVNIVVDEETLIGRDEVEAGNKNKQNEDQEFRPQNEVYTVDTDDTVNITRVGQPDEDNEDMDLIIDHVCVELQAVNKTQSCTIEDEVIRPRTEVEKDLVNNRCQIEPSTMVIDIVPEEQNCEPRMERTELLQKDALIEETEKSMNITDANEIQNPIEVTEFENENQNEPNETIDLVNSNCEAEPCTMVMNIALEEQERQVSMERTISLQNDARIGETGMNAPETKSCGEECEVNEQSVDDHACLMDDVEVQERESDVIEVEHHLNDAWEIHEERDEQVITEQNQREVQECEVSMEGTESLQKDAHDEETAKTLNIAEANVVQDLIEELEFENENHNEPNETIDFANGDSQSEPSTMVINVAIEEKEHQVGMERTESLEKDTQIEETGTNVTEMKECGKERDTTEQSVDGRTCLMNSAERHERDSDLIEEENHLKDAFEIFEEQDEQTITEQNQTGEHECEVIMERTESIQNYPYVEETGEDTNETEAIQVGDRSSEKLKFEKENQNEPTELNECDEEIECYINWQSVEDQACEVNGVELQEQEYEENRFSGESEEENHLKDACEFVEERDQVITERYQPEVSMEGTESLQKENQNDPTELNECDEEIECYISWQSVEDQACEVNGVELQEQEYEENRFSGESEEENHLKDACEFVEKRDQVITMRYQPEVQECEVSMEGTESLQKDAHDEETAMSMNIEANVLQDLIKELEFENENHNEPNETIDLANGDIQIEPSTVVINVALKEKEHQVCMERTESLEKDTQIEETGMNVIETKECDKEHDTNEQSVDGQTCLTNGVERQEQDSNMIEEENHWKDAYEIFEEQDEQAITEQNQPGEQKIQVSFERTESTQNYAYVEETGEDTNETEAIQVGDLSSEKLKFAKENQNEPTEVNECDEEIECYINWQSVEDQACEVNGVELQEQEYEVNRFPGESDEKNHLKDTCEFVEERAQAITDKENEGLEIFGKRCKQGRETGSEQYPSQKLNKDGVNEGESQQSEEQKQEKDMHGEYDIRDEAQRASEIEQIDAFKEQEEHEDMNQQLKEQRQDACPSQRLQEDGVDKSKSQHMEEQNQEIEMHEEYENLDQARQLLEKLKICASKVQEKNEDVNDQLNEVKQDEVIDKSVKFGERFHDSMLECEQNNVSEMELGGNCTERTNALEQRSDTLSAKKSPKVKAVNAMQQVEKRQLRPRSDKAQPIESKAKRSTTVPSLEKSSETKRTYALEQRSDTLSAKKSPKVKAVNAVQQVEKRQLRPRFNKAQPIESKAKRSITVPSLENSSETNQRKKLRVSKQLEHGTRRSLRLQKSRSGN